MANATITDSTISVHGRGSLELPVQIFDPETCGPAVQRDIHADTYYFEVDGANIRKQLVANPLDPLGLLLQLTRTEVESLLTTPLRFALIDETDATYPVVEWFGTIARFGYTGTPE
jgi:hypothetical protein